MSVHPIEFRYNYPKMYAVFTEEAKLQSWLDVETALVMAHAELGTIPMSAAEEIERKAKVGIVRIERVKEIEEMVRHDLFAMVRALQETCEGDAGKYVHLGATSSDIVDTALALQLRKAMSIIESDLKIFLEELLNKAVQHCETSFIVRGLSHQASPITYGLMLASWATEVARHLDRFGEVQKRILVGKMNGAIGTMAGFGKRGYEIQRIVMERLGLKPALITNQIIQRDRHAELQCLLSLIACSIDNIIRYLNDLQHLGFVELSGTIHLPRSLGQNHHFSSCECISNLARTVRGSLTASLESIALEHERDISHSSVERIIIPEGFILVDYILRQTTNKIKYLTYNRETIDCYTKKTIGLFLAERVKEELVQKSVDLQESHGLVIRLMQKARIENRSLRELLEEDPKVTRYITPEKLDMWLKPVQQKNVIENEVNRVISELRRRHRLVQEKEMDHT